MNMGLEVISQWTSGVVNAAEQAANKVLEEARTLKSSLYSESAHPTVVNKFKLKANETFAAIRWSSLGSYVKVPLSTEPDVKFYVSVMDLARALLTEFSNGEDIFQPITCSLLSLVSWVHFHPVRLRDYCLSPYCVVEKKEISRIFKSSIVHYNDTHICSNIAAIISDILYLERKNGPWFLLDLISINCLSGFLYVGWASFLKEYMKDGSEYFATGAIGASSIAFGLQVLSGLMRSNKVMCFGFEVDSEFTWVFRLAISHLCASGSSFAGHLCGVVSGIIYSYIIRPAFLFMWDDENPFEKDLESLQPPPRKSSWHLTSKAAPTISKAIISPKSSRQAGAIHKVAPSGFRRHMKRFIIQLGLVAVSAGIYVHASRYLKEHPITITTQNVQYR